MSTPETQAGPAPWIGRDRPGRITPESPAQPTPVPTPEQEAVEPWWRRRALLGVAAVVAALVIGALLFSALRHKAATVPLAAQRNVPLITVVTPGLKAVTSTVTFTGAIAARYDMPIGNDGDTGRIVAVYVEAGDHVRKGQLLAKLDDSVLIPQVNRLPAALQQGKGPGAPFGGGDPRAPGG